MEHIYLDKTFLSVQTNANVFFYSFQNFFIDIKFNLK